MDTPKLNKNVYDSIPSLDLKAEDEISSINKNESQLMNTSFNNSSLITPTIKQRLFKGIFNELILWPDASLFKLKDLPACVLTPRYIYAPPEATSN